MPIKHCARCARLPVFKTHLELLLKFRQRATYGAFGKALGTSVRSPLKDHVLDELHCWVVAQDGAPTGYGPGDIHPEIAKRANILTTEADYRAWHARPS